MDKLILKSFKVVVAALMILAVVFQVIVLSNGDDTSESILSSYIVTSYIALGIAAALSLLFPIAFMIKNPKNAVKMLMVIAGFVVLGFISYALASNTLTSLELEKYEITASVEKGVGAALIFTYIIGAASILSILYSSFSSFFKK